MKAVSSAGLGSSSPRFSETQQLLSPLDLLRPHIDLCNRSVTRTVTPTRSSNIRQLWPQSCANFCEAFELERHSKTDGCTSPSHAGIIELLYHGPSRMFRCRVANFGS